MKEYDYNPDWEAHAILLKCFNSLMRDLADNPWSSPLSREKAVIILRRASWHVIGLEEPYSWIG